MTKIFYCKIKKKIKKNLLICNSHKQAKKNPLVGLNLKNQKKIKTQAQIKKMRNCS